MRFTGSSVAAVIKGPLYCIEVLNDVYRELRTLLAALFVFDVQIRRRRWKAEVEDPELITALWVSVPSL